MPATRRHSPLWHPPDMLPVQPDDEPGPWRAIPLAALILSRLQHRGESTLSEVLEMFAPAEWCGATDALDELVRDGSVGRRIIVKTKWVKIAVYRSV
jgi:hypothetical protein